MSYVDLRVHIKAICFEHCGSWALISGVDGKWVLSELWLRPSSMSSTIVMVLCPMVSMEAPKCI